jgi:uncharacterized membrane protein HdeD (DUF308 family)
MTKFTLLTEGNHLTARNITLLLGLPVWENKSNVMKKHFAPRLLMTTAIGWLVIGTCAFVSESNAMLSAIAFASVALLIDSLVLVTVASTCDAGIKEREWIIAVAAVSGLFSILFLLDPGCTLFPFPFLVSAWMVGKGFLTMIAALASKSSTHKWRGDLTGGFLFVFCGLLISFHLLDHPYVANALLGAIGWTIGLLYVYDAYGLQKINPIFPASHRGKTVA